MEYNKNRALALSISLVSCSLLFSAEPKLPTEPSSVHDRYEMEMTIPQISGELSSEIASIPIPEAIQKSLSLLEYLPANINLINQGTPKASAIEWLFFLTCNGKHLAQYFYYDKSGSYEQDVIPYNATALAQSIFAAKGRNRKIRSELNGPGSICRPISYKEDLEKVTADFANGTLIAKWDSEENRFKEEHRFHLQECSTAEEHEKLAYEKWKRARPWIQPLDKNLVKKAHSLAGTTQRSVAQSPCPPTPRFGSTPVPRSFGLIGEPVPLLSHRAKSSKHKKDLNTTSF